MSLFAELKRRNVFRAGLAYLVMSWLLLQVVDVVGPILEIPDWVPKLVLLIITIGFVPVLLFTWAFELTPDGIRKEQDVDRSTAGYRDLGRKLNGLIIAVLVLALAWFAWDKFMRTGAPPTGTVAEVSSVSPPEQSTPVVAEKSIAVLPFTLRSDQKSDEYFSQGIHDDLLTQLVRIDGIRVISRTSVMQYAGTTLPIPEIAAELGVATLLEGSIQRAGDRVRVTAQLIDAASDTHLWAQSWDKELTVSNIFEIQSELATLIAGALESEIAPDVQQRIDDKPTQSLEAYELTLQGRYLMDKELSEDNLRRAAGLFRQAIQADPDYSGAWAGLSQALQELVGWHYVPENEMWPEAREAARRAVDLGPENTAALLALGDIQRIERRRLEGEKTYLRAIELSPGDADAHGRYSDLLRDDQRFDESVREIRLAVELDPHLIRIRESLLQNVYFSRDYETVYREAEEILQLEPGAAGAWYWLSLAQTMSGDYDAAERSMRRAIELDPGNSYYEVGMAYVYAFNERPDEALVILESAESNNVSLVEIALVYGILGDLDAAFGYMDRAFEETPTALFYIAADPGADALRGDPRWQQLLDRLTAGVK